MEIISNIALISINETLVIQLISFLIFLFVINRVMIRPLRRAMAERETYADQLKSEMKDAESEIIQVTQQIREQETDVINEARLLSEELEQTGKQEAETIYQSARSDVEQKMKEAESEVNTLIEKARQSVRAESEALAVEIMEKMLDRRLV